MYPTSPSRPYSHLIRARHAYWGNWCGMTRIESSSTMKKHWPIQNHATRRRVLYKYIVDYCNMWIDESSKDLMVNWDTTLHKKSIHDLSLKLPWRCEGTKHGDMQSVFRWKLWASVYGKKWMLLVAITRWSKQVCRIMQARSIASQLQPASTTKILSMWWGGWY